jgi:hypothetical protein
MSRMRGRRTLFVDISPGVFSNAEQFADEAVNGGREIAKAFTQQFHDFLPIHVGGIGKAVTREDVNGVLIFLNEIVCCYKQQQQSPINCF